MTVQDQIAEQRNFILWLLRKKVDDVEKAKDLTQDVLLKAILSCNQYTSDKGTIRSWLAVITNSVYCDYMRRKSNHTVHVPFDMIHAGIDNYTPDKALIAGELENLIDTAGTREFKMHHVEGCTYQEISKELGGSQLKYRVSNVRTRRYLRSLVSRW